MGVREKVALLLAFLTLTQIVFVCCSIKEETPNKSYLIKKKQARNIEVITHPPRVIALRPQVRRSKTKSKQEYDRSYEALRKIFNFPDNEYPTASTPRPPFYLQETNILQRSPVQRAVEYPTSTTQQMPKSANIKEKNKQIYRSKPTNFKTVKKPGVALNTPDFSTTPKPYYIREENAFPDVEYPLSAKDTWTPFYWKPIPSMGSTNQINNNIYETPSKASSNAKGSIRSTGQVSKPESKKALKKKQQIETLVSNKNSGKRANKNTPIKESTSTTPLFKSSKTNNETNNTTTPFVLTPYTTLYFDTTPTYDSFKTTNISENSAVGDVSNSYIQKKKSTKKEHSSTKSNTSDICKGQVESDKPKDSLVKSSTLPEETTTKTPVRFSTETPHDPICTANLNISNKCINNMSNDILSSTPITTPTSCLNSNIDSTHILLNKSENDKIVTISKDKKLTSISDAMHTIVSNNRYNKSSRFEDNATTLMNNKSSTCEDKTIDSLLSPREDVIVPPSSDEEFTTDVFPDFDENDLLPIFTVTTSTLSPYIVSDVDEAWQNSDVIDPYKSLSYPDELEQYYILVP